MAFALGAFQICILRRHFSCELAKVLQPRVKIELASARRARNWLCPARSNQDAEYHPREGLPRSISHVQNTLATWSRLSQRRERKGYVAGWDLRYSNASRAISRSPL